LGKKCDIFAKQNDYITPAKRLTSKSRFEGLLLAFNVMPEVWREGLFAGELKLGCYRR
jgi:hypothetical protein